jgi:hypothetical protein
VFTELEKETDAPSAIITTDSLIVITCVYSSHEHCQYQEACIFLIATSIIPIVSAVSQTVLLCLRTVNRAYDARSATVDT